ncbi:hypothetical protein Pla110_28020 [Polystyrenella longa]|uniref:Neutral/alkaline non-lysosomal ceramidase n=1 Tax=Polystyrenella longa TaxID=2528007 RepID=A0A518CPB6_9PLAN|nr:hypothetical protein [Polystyrenella longa]QDU81065.1 hypothetical protein Pla110_28020 [Polystyrenella longa]
MRFNFWLLSRSALSCLSFFLMMTAPLSAEIKIAKFNVNATPEIGGPVAYASVRSVQDPLSARGIVLTFDNQKPVVLCAIDWIGIYNSGQDIWKEKLAAAAGTTSDRVAVHGLHQHDGARCDFGTEEKLQAVGLGGMFFDNDFCLETIERVTAAIKTSLSEAEAVTHIGTSKAKVEKVASNRRLLGDDGKVKMMRWSSSRDAEAIAAPEGVIDPFVHQVSFWNSETPLAVLSYYATHPQSHYGKGDVTCEFVGIARNDRDKEVPSALHVHFTGAAGNVAAGKYNDASPENRPVLAERLRTGMESAWSGVEKQPITEEECRWVAHKVLLPISEDRNEKELANILNDDSASDRARVGAAMKLSWWERSQTEWNAEISVLRLGNVQILHMPGEMFVEYSLAAEKMRPEHFVCMAAYGQGGCSYIGTEIAYWQGGYETGKNASSVSPDVEKFLMKEIETLLTESEAP